MNRYHKKIYFPKESQKELFDLTEKLNKIEFRYSKHCLENLKYRALDIENLLKYIKDIELKSEWIFEYYKSNYGIEKMCYRLPYILYDVILIISNTKNIITIYINSKEDNHDTLNRRLYNLK